MQVDDRTTTATNIKMNRTAFQTGQQVPIETCRPRRMQIIRKTDSQARVNDEIGDRGVEMERKVTGWGPEDERSAGSVVGDGVPDMQTPVLM
jgi:hypothetical protein